jgi:NAD(P)-dependent dehydrogenase (short-subunit alcohol dehydrogenase family)
MLQCTNSSGSGGLLERKNALVTGSTSGIGLAIVRECKSEIACSPADDIANAG